MEIKAFCVQINRENWKENGKKNYLRTKLFKK